VRPDKLRFDFTHPQALTEEERDRVERRVNEKVFENHPVRAFETPIAEARRLGATMLFGEKYGDIVRVVEIDGYSRELCGGTHVRSTAEIGPFAILSESSVGSGARRIEAVTSGEAWAYLHAQARALEEVRAEATELRKELKRKGATGGRPSSAGAEVPPPRVVNDVSVIVHAVAELDADALLELSDQLKQRHAPAAVVLGSAENGRVHLVANFDQAVAEKISASDVVRGAAALVGGGGGGRSTMARAGGKEPERLGDALAEAEKLILAAL
jgi:alanyl-tRNA synthetase